VSNVTKQTRRNLHRRAGGEIRIMVRMRVISINVGRPRLHTWKGQTFSTGIFKEPVSGRIMLRRTNLDGDRQADLSVHGGPDKAAYAYPSEHYSYWARQFPGRDLPWGSFGENFTTEGLLETEVSVGDRYRIGSAVVMVKTPRVPCFKLAAKFQTGEFQTVDMIERFLLAGRSGFYFSVMEEGEVGAGDEIQFMGGEPATLNVAETYKLYWSPEPDVELLRRAAQIKVLPEGWRQRFQAKLAAAESSI
jgi:MOSC domain-containing protein YiiM